MDGVQGLAGHAGARRLRRLGQELLEVGLTVDLVEALGIGAVLGVGHRVAQLQQLLVPVGGVLHREEAVGEAQLVHRGVAGEGEQRGHLRLPAEASDLALGLGRVLGGMHAVGAAADAGRRERLPAHDVLRLDGLHQAVPERGRRDAEDVDVGLRRDELQALRRDGLALQQRAAQILQRIEGRARVAEARDHLGPRPADVGQGVARGAALVVHDGAQAGGGVEHVLEGHLAVVEAGLLRGVEAGQRLAHARLDLLGGDGGGGQDERRDRDVSHQHGGPHSQKWTSRPSE
jgi:hypothetical protein